MDCFTNNIMEDFSNFSNKETIAFLESNFFLKVWHEFCLDLGQNLKTSLLINQIFNQTLSKI